jgi:hypothetical protein
MVNRDRALVYATNQQVRNHRERTVIDSRKVAAQQSYEKCTTISTLSSIISCHTDLQDAWSQLQSQLVP